MGDVDGVAGQWPWPIECKQVLEPRIDVKREGVVEWSGGEMMGVPLQFVAGANGSEESDLTGP